MNVCAVPAFVKLGTCSIWALEGDVDNGGLANIVDSANSLTVGRSRSKVLCYPDDISSLLERFLAYSQPSLLPRQAVRLDAIAGVQFADRL
jgi:hypothetical protein